MTDGTDTQKRSVRSMQRAAATMSEMLVHAVTEERRLQKGQEKALGRHYASRAELAANYDTKTMKELTAILKDITAVAKALEEKPADAQGGTGVVLLPSVSMETPAPEQQP